MASNAEPVPREATDQDVRDAPEHLVAEILDGDLVLSPRPALPHAVAASQLGGALHAPFGRRPGGAAERPGGWWILDEPEPHFARQVLVPDLAGWRRERLPYIPKAAFLELAPDWVCEVVSPESARHDRIRNMRIFAELQVGHAWLVDPLAKTLEVFRLVNGVWSSVAGLEDQEQVRAEPFDAIEPDLADWWLLEPAPPAAAPSPGEPRA